MKDYKEFGAINTLIKGASGADVAGKVRPALMIDLLYSNGANFAHAVRMAGAEGELTAFHFCDLCAELLDGWERSSHGADARAFVVATRLFNTLKNELYAAEATQIATARRGA